MRNQKCSKPKRKSRKCKRKKTKYWRQQRHRARRQRANRRKRWRQQKRKLPRWEARPQGVRGSFTHLLLFLLSLDVPLIGSQAQTLAAFVVGAPFASSAHLPQIAAVIPLKIKQRSRLRRLERFLQSNKVEPMAVMGPIVRWLLKRIKEQRIYLALDFTTDKDKFLVAMVSLVWGKRTIPLSWAVGLANTKGVSRKALAQQAVRQVAEWIPQNKEVVFLADREFRSKAWRRLMRKELKWHFVIRLSADRTWVYLPNSSVLSLRDLKASLQPGDARYWIGVYLTKHRDGPYQMAAVWDQEADEPWFLVSELPDPEILPKIYARRWRIESSFRDFKSYGFGLEASRIEDLERFNRLLLGLALAYGWAVRIGHWLDQSGQRHLVDRGSKPKQSAYRLGRYWLVHLWSLGSDQIEQVHFANVPP